MSFPRMSLHIGDYCKDTGHLDAALHGAYLLLIMHYWATGGLPDDSAQLARIARMTAQQWRRAKPILQAFFHDGWKHERIDEELAAANEKYEKRSSAGKKGVLSKKHKRLESQASAMLKQPITDNPNQEETKTDIEFKTHIRAVAKATRPGVDEKFNEFWGVYPKRDGANPKHPAAQSFKRALKSGVDPGEIVAAARRYASTVQAGTRHVAQAVTWLNQRRWIDYPAVAAASEPAWKRPPPGCRPLEIINAEIINGACDVGQGSEIRTDTGLGEARANLA